MGGTHNLLHSLLMQTPLHGSMENSVQCSGIRGLCPTGDVKLLIFVSLCCPSFPGNSVLSVTHKTE